MAIGHRQTQSLFILITLSMSQFGPICSVGDESFNPRPTLASRDFVEDFYNVDLDSQEFRQAQRTQPPSSRPPSSRPPPSRQPPSSRPRAATQPSRRRLSLRDFRLARAPNMFGDSTGGACGVARFEGSILAAVNHPTFGCTRVVIAENNSPVPRDRYYFTYQHFHNATDLFLQPDGPAGGTFESSLNIDRYTFGIERTFDCGNSSFELRIPFATQLNNTPVLEPTGPLAPTIDDHLATSISNISVLLKRVLYRCDDELVSGGFAVQFPTAPDVSVRDYSFDLGPPRLDFVNLFDYKNESIILSPFLGVVRTPTDDVFWQAFTQVEFDLTGSEMTLTPFVNGVLDPSRNRTVRINGQVLMRANLSAGWWVYRTPDQCGGIALVSELHWTSTLDNAQIRILQQDPALDTPVAIGNGSNRQDVVNFTCGPVFRFTNGSTLRIGSVVPLRTGDNRGFDYELNVQFNWFFGGNSSG